MRLHRYGERREMNGYPSGNLAVRRSALPGDFDTELLRGQDKDLCYRIIQMGYKIIFEPGAIVYHDNPSSFMALTNYFVKGALGRAILSKKYKKSPDIIFFSYHSPLIYIALLVLSILLKHTAAFWALILTPLVFLLAEDIKAYTLCRKPFLSFIVKPVLDIFSILVTYVAFQYYKVTYNKILRR